MNPNIGESRRGKPRPIGAGRTKGIPNKKTTEVKDALQMAFDGLGGVTALMAWAREEPGMFYSLWVKILPKEIKSQITGGDSSIKIEITDLRQASEIYKMKAKSLPLLIQNG